jgi:hypothetical protein
MAANRKTIDTDMIYLRQIQARTSLNQLIPNNHVLVSNGDGSTRWDSLSSIAPTSSFTYIEDSSGNVLFADNINSGVHISTSGPAGLLTSAIDQGSAALILRHAPPTVIVSQRPVPEPSAFIVNDPPDPVYIENYSSIQLFGVRDVILSTVVGDSTPSVFISISSFTSEGYSTLSGETNAWRPYIYSTLSTAIAYTSFVSSMPLSWAQGDQPLSTEPYPSYSTGDVYFSTLTFSGTPYISYVTAETKLILEAEPTYMLPRFFFGSDPYPNLLKSISSYVKYTNRFTSTTILNESMNTDWIVSQQSNVYMSNFFNKPMKLPISSGTFAANWQADGALGYYTLHHRIPGGMAELVPGDACGYAIGMRGGMSNTAPTFTNLTPPQNGAFMHVYNRGPPPA